MGKVYDAANYHGHLDVGVAITGIEGAHSALRAQNFMAADFTYSAPTFTRTASLAAAELQKPAEAAHALLRHFYEATTGIDGYNPFAQSN